MRKKAETGLILICGILALSLCMIPALSGAAEKTRSRDEMVRSFLDSHKDQWVAWNVPAADGKVLYELIIRNQYKRAVEIGTSTGHSAIWMAWALSKTGGRLITIEIDEGRYRQALANFAAAGLSEFIDARLADAHELVMELKGPFDFVFSDADKGWYKNYFMALAPKLEVGGCFTAHNATSGFGSGISEFLEYVKSRSDFKTEINTASPAGISISCKISK